MGSEKSSDYMCLRKPIHNRPCHARQERRDNEIRDTLAKMLEETYRDIKTEPVLLPLTGEELRRKKLIL